MNHIKTAIILSVFGLLLSGCVGATIQETTTVHQKIGASFDVGVGGEVYSSNSVKNLPNAFGKADIYGRTTPTGRTSIVFAGIQKNKVVLARSSVDIDTGATTMNSTPMVISNTQTSYHSGNIGGSYYSGSTRTYGQPTVIMPNTPSAKYFSRGTIPIIIPLKDLPASIPIEDHVIKIMNATSYKITVMILKK